MSRLASAAAVGIGALLVVAAWGVTQLAPSDELRESPVAVRVEPGERGVGRNIAGTAFEAVVAERLTDGGGSAPWNGETTGVWVVVRIEAESVRRPGALVSTLFYGDLRVPASDRPSGRFRLEGSSLPPGIPVSGWLAFEVPADMPMPATAALELAAGIDARLDNVIVAELDLATAPRVAELELDPVVTGRAS